jgi:hypothetical protein
MEITAEQMDVIRDATEASVIGAYNKGLSDGYGHMIKDLERWIV